MLGLSVDDALQRLAGRPAVAAALQPVSDVGLGYLRLGEPTPSLTGVFGRLLRAGATIIVIDHDLDLLAVADHLIDMGQIGGPDGGRILATGTPGMSRAPRPA